MKKFLKFVGWAIVGLIVIGVIAGLGSSGDKTQKTSTKAVETVTKEEKADKKPGKAEFEQVKSGMTLAEVEKILGPAGTVDGESESNGIKYQSYSWEAKGDFGANITVSFVNGKSDTKAQFGLE
jgi:hypothetical protein